MSLKNAGKPTQKGAIPKPSVSGQAPSKTDKAQVENPALFLSAQYLRFKLVASQLSDDLKPYGMSITALEKSLAHYVSKQYTFPVDKVLLTKLSDYQEAKVAWESFRDAFRAAKDAETIPQGALAKLLGKADSDTYVGGAPSSSNDEGGVPGP